MYKGYILCSLHDNFRHGLRLFDNLDPIFDRRDVVIDGQGDFFRRFRAIFHELIGNLLHQALGILPWHCIQCGYS